MDELKQNFPLPDELLNCTISDVQNNILVIAGCFDNVDDYLDKFRLSTGMQTDVKDKAHLRGTRAGMMEALNRWSSQDPNAATLHVLLERVLELGKGDVAMKLAEVFTRVRLLEGPKSG